MGLELLCEIGCGELSVAAPGAALNLTCVAAQGGLRAVGDDGGEEFGMKERAVGRQEIGDDGGREWVMRAGGFGGLDARFVGAAVYLVGVDGVVPCDVAGGPDGCDWI